jgi:hypothetical protein
MGLVAVVLDLAIMTAYAWLITAGRMTSCPSGDGLPYRNHPGPYVDLYSMLGDSFLRGHTYLQIEPEPGLLALPNPYDPVLGKLYLNDLSFYQGKYYAYYGPVPGVLTVPVTWAGCGRVRDWHLVFAFLSGGLVFSTLLIRELWRRLFPDVPEWTQALGVLVAGLGAPIPCVLVGLNREAFHEASSAGGLFFMLGC